MRRARLLIVFLAAGALAAGLYAWLREATHIPEDVLATRGGVETIAPSPLSPAPRGEISDRFVFQNPYLDGRSAWFREQFAAARAELRSLEPPAGPTVSCKVRRKPFTAGDWLERLDEGSKRERDEIESNAVESTLVFFVPDVQPRELIVYLASSDYLERVPGEGTIEVETYVPQPAQPPQGLESLPVLGRNQWLSRVHWKRSQALARPTAAYYLNAALRDGELLVLLEEAWRNFGGSGYVPVRMEATQIAVAARRGGSLAHLTSFYSGQTIPLFTDGIAARLTEAFHRKVAGLVAAEAKGWKAPPEAVSFFQSIGLE
jgi:hypothetical protein